MLQRRCRAGFVVLLRACRRPTCYASRVLAAPPDRLEVAVKHLLLALALTLVAGPLVAGQAQAISRYTSTSMSCARVQATIQREGAVIMRWSSPRSGAPLFGRFVTWNENCGNRMRPQRAFIPAADTQSCPVLECQRWDPEDGFLFLR
jgi:hypothetical protein